MKKFWLYMTVPMAVLGSCQNQEPYLESTEHASLQGEVAEYGEQFTAADKSREAAQTEAQNAVQEVVQAVMQAAYPIQIQEAKFSGSTVTIAKSKEAQAEDITEAEIETMVRAVAGDLDQVVKNGQTVVLKPNLVQMIVDSTGESLDQEVNGVTTDWRVTKAIVKMVRELNPDGTVYIMEGSASGPTSAVMEHFHYTPEYMEGVDGFICLEEDCGAWQDFNAPEVVKVNLPDGLLHQTYYFSRILYEADVVISIPTLKTSSGVVVTGSIKNISIGTPPGNLYGKSPTNPSKMNMVSHGITDGELDQWIYDYYMAKPISYVIVDGLQGFQSGPVPMSQDKKESDKMNMGIIMGGIDPVAVDTVCSLVTGWDPQSVGYLNLLKANTERGELDEILVKGHFVDELRKNFTLHKPNLGGDRIETAVGPEFTAVAEQERDNLKIHYQADGNVFKVEVYVDGVFQYSGTASQVESIQLEIPGLSAGSHEIRIIAYDRFLNKTVVTTE